MCLLVEETALTPRKAPPSSPLLFDRSPRLDVHWLPQRGVSQITGGGHKAECLCVCGKKVKETHILLERGGQAEGVTEWEREGFNDAENWPVTAVHPSGKSSLQLAVNLSVPLSSHLAPPTPKLGLPPPHPDSTSFTTTYSKLPSSSHTHPVTINNWSLVSVCISKLWIHSVKPFLLETRGWNVTNKGLLKYHI